MFESSLLSQINIASPIPSFVEVDFVNSLNKSLTKAFHFAHVLLAEKSDIVAACLPWGVEIWLVLQSFLEYSLLNHTNATFAEMLFALRCGAIESPARPFASQGMLSWLICGPAPIPSLEEQALMAADSAALPQSTMTEGNVQLSAEEAHAARCASYGHLRFGPLTKKQRCVTLIQLTLKPYLEERFAKWYAEQKDTSGDAVMIRNEYARQYPNRARVKKILTFLYPILHTISEGLSFLYQILFLLEFTPYTTPLYRVFNIALRRLTKADQIATSNPRAQRVLMLVRLLFLLLFFGFRLLELTNVGNGGTGHDTSVTAGDDIAIPQPPVWGVDVVAPPGTKPPQPGMCPVCERRINNAAVLVVSGVVGCYACLQQYTAEHGLCPVTKRKTTVEFVRRIYES